MNIRASAPCRIDLAGGTLDFHPIYLLLPQACTINLAIDITVEIEISDLEGDAIELRSADLGLSWTTTAGREEAVPPGLELLLHAVKHLAPEGGLLVRSRSNSPPGGGLAASSALCVALVSALLARRGENMSTGDLVRLCLDLEAQAMGTPAGCQDFFPAIKGGLQEIIFAPGGVISRPAEADPAELRRRIVLACSANPHHSGLNNWEVYKRFIDGENGVKAAFREIGYIAVQMAGALRSGDWPAVGRLLGREWQQRKRLWPGVATPTIDALIAEAERLGGSGKVCGAGGGGCVILWHDGSREEDLREAALSLGSEVIDWEPAAAGCSVIVS